MIRNINLQKAIIKRACTSPSINAWKVQLNNKPFLITPAHVAVHPDRKNKYLKSTFLNGLDDRIGWRIPRLYSPGSFAYDFAWAPLDDDESDCIKSFSIDAHSFVDVDLFFQNPYDATGYCDNNTSELGYVSAGIYPSPRSQLFEALDVGFKGMSGALVTTVTEGVAPVAVGMLLRRGIPIPMDAQPPIRFDPDSVVSADAKVLLSALQRMAGSMLTREDVNALHHVTAMRRGIVMPVRHMLELMEDSVLLDDVVGKPATAENLYYLAACWHAPGSGGMFERTALILVA